MTSMRLRSESLSDDGQVRGWNRCRTTEPTPNPASTHNLSRQNSGKCWPSRSLPEILCLWAGERHDLVCHSIKHLAGQIRGGNWASRRMLVERCP